MKRVRYTKYEGGLAGEMSMEDLLNALSDYLLDSGFQNPWMEFGDLDHTMDALRDALKRALNQASCLTKTCSNRSTRWPPMAKWTS